MRCAPPPNLFSLPSSLPCTTTRGWWRRWASWRCATRQATLFPGEVRCSLDLRSANEAQLADAYEALRTYTAAIATQRNVELEWTLVQQTAPVACADGLNGLLALAIAEAGHEVVALVSGAGHDAVPISAVAPATMLFIRCFQGISHNPLENVELTDLAAALEVADRFLVELKMKN
jgi:allantoate deiminase